MKLLTLTPTLIDAMKQLGDIIKKERTKTQRSRYTLVPLYCWRPHYE